MGTSATLPGERFGCHACWPESAADAWEARRSLTLDVELVDESHFHVMVLKCGQCRQRYLSLFCETIDWTDGDDPQHWILLPISSPDMESLVRAGPRLTESDLRAMGHGRRSLVYDHPKGKAPTCDWRTGVRIPPHD